ncbi:hypothetical protein [Candidatus Phytoplasma sp. AldY-WA1]|uniref:hypothetical protein n=1 Tax=Candidatus Phytoplasma sp. AldY-WA1 TaxID=2852100 RepID=UPI00254EC12E|nr:hypothetical protein [Candidatus Phytoplasma sp. AldY-WA1]
MNFDYEKIIKIIDNVIIECSFFVNQWSKDLIKLKEDGFRNIFAISLNMRLNRNGEHHEYSIDNEALSLGGKTDISIKTCKNYQFRYIIEVKIYSTNKDIIQAFYQISEYSNPYKYASIIMINKYKKNDDFLRTKDKIKDYFEKNEKFKIVNQNETKYESIKLELVYHLDENVKYNIFFYYVDFYSKQMNKPHTIDKEFFTKQKIITKSEFELIKKYILGKIKTNSIPLLDSVTQKDKYLHKIYKNQEKSLKHTEKTISEISNLNPDEEKDIKEFLNKQKEIKAKDKKNLTIFEANLDEYLEKLYIIKDDNKKNKKS